MHADHPALLTRSTVLLLVIIAAAAFAGGQFAERYGSFGQRRWHLLLSQQHRSSDEAQRVVLDCSKGPCKHAAAGEDDQWCWIRVPCNGAPTAEQPGLQQATAAAAAGLAGQQTAAKDSQQDISVAHAADLQQVTPAPAPGAKHLAPTTAPAPQAVQPAAAPLQEVSQKAAPRKPPPKPILDVVGLAVKPTCINRAAVAGLLRHVRPRAVHVVTSTARQCVAFRSWGAAVNCHTQDALVPGLTKASVQQGLQQRFSVDSNEELKGRTMAGWYLQQFLKLGAAAALPGLSEHFLIWDMDMVPLRPLPLLTRLADAADIGTAGGSQYQTLVNIGGVSDDEWVAGYKATYRALFGRPLAMAPDGSSLVTHMLVVYKPFMAQMLADVANTTAPAPPTAWISRILDALPKDNLNAGFSEYATYLSWVRERHPGSQRLAGSVTWSRYGPGGWDAVVAAAREAPDGLCCPTPQQLQDARKQGLEYCGWDVGHVPECKYSDAKYAEAYGVELPAVRRRQLHQRLQ